MLLKQLYVHWILGVLVGNGEGSIVEYQSGLGIIHLVRTQNFPKN